MQAHPRWLRAGDCLQRLRDWDDLGRLVLGMAAHPNAKTHHVWTAWQLSVNTKLSALRSFPFLVAPLDRGVRPAFQPLP